MGRTGTTRRSVLLAAGTAGAALSAGCSGEPADGRIPDGSTGTAARAAAALRLRSAGISKELLGRYDAVVERHPAQLSRLAPLRAAVALHVTALAPGTPAPARTRQPAPPSPSVTAAGTGPRAVAADPVQAVKALAAAERRTADAHAAALLDAPPELARLLASLAAASEAHAFLLTEGARP